MAVLLKLIIILTYRKFAVIARFFLLGILPYRGNDINVVRLAEWAVQKKVRKKQEEKPWG
jgi:hypothetical protein